MGHLSQHTIKVVCTAFLLVPVAASAAETTNRMAATFDLYARPAPGVVQLKWTFDQWPDELEGLRVQRRMIAPVTTEWAVVNSVPLRPETALRRNWSQIEPDFAEQEILQIRLESLLSAGTLPELAPDEFIQKLQNDPDFCLTVNDRIYNTWEFPFLVGAAFSDRTLPMPGRYEYALYPVGKEVPSNQVLAVCEVMVSSEKQLPARLYAERSGESVRLLWLPSRWPADLDGVIPCRKKTDGTWQRLAPSAIRPQTSPERDWSLTGLHRNEQKSLKQQLEEMIREGAVIEMTADEARKQLASMNRKQFSGDLLRLMGSYTYALITGFAAVDAAPPNGEVIYGLLPVRDGVIDDFPVVTYTLGDPVSPVPVDYSVLKTEQGILLEWSISREEYENRALQGFSVYRAPFGRPARPTCLTPTVAGYVREEGNLLIWKFYDTSADRDTSWRYDLRPVTMFQQEKPAVDVVYEPQPSRLETFKSLAGLKLKSINQTAPGLVQVQWDFPSSAEDVIAGFVVERADLPDRELRVVSSTLPPTSRTFEDRLDKAHGDSCTYRVTAVDQDGPLRNSDMALLVYRDMRKPPAPQNLKARFIDDSDPLQVEFSWDSPLPEDELTDGFLVYADRIREGEVLRLAGEAQLHTNRYRLTVPARNGRSYTFRVAARSHYGTEGDYVQTTVDIPLQHLPRIRDLRSNQQKDRIKLEWEYKSQPHLVGFRVLHNGEVLADEKELGPTARSWQSDPLTPNAFHRFCVFAIGDNGVMSRPSNEAECFYVDANALKSK